MSSKDVHNLVYRLRKSKRPGELHSRVKAVLDEFASYDGNVVRVFKNEANVANCITLATKNMRQHFATFGQIVIMDSTHGTNSSQYKLFGMMVHDKYGRGQFVQHALIHSENKINFTSVIEAFKESNPQWNDVLKVIMVSIYFTFNFYDSALFFYFIFRSIRISLK